MSQTEAVEGRWGKAGINARLSLDARSANVFTQANVGNGVQVDPPSSGADHVAGRFIGMGGRTQNDGEGGFELNSSVPNNIFPETTAVPAPANTTWLQLNWSKSSNSYWMGVADDVGDVPGPWALTPIQKDVALPDADGLYLGLMYSAHNDMSPAGQLHGVTFDNYSVGSLVPHPDFSIVVDTDLVLEGVLELVRGPDTIERGLGQQWYDRDLRSPDAFAARAPLNREPFTTEPWSWFRMQSGNAFTEGVARYPDHPVTTEIDPMMGPGGPVGPSHSISYTGQIFFQENGFYCCATALTTTRWFAST